jgi:hypothetical protein
LLASVADVGRAVRRLFALEGEFAPDDAAMPRTLRLGHRRRESGERLDVLLTRAAWDAGFAGMLAERATHPWPTLVLAPTATHLGSDLVARYAGPGRVQLAFLEDVLAVHGGELALAHDVEGRAAPAPQAPFGRALTNEGELALAEGAEGLTGAAPRRPFCRALTNEGERALDRTAYHAWCANEPPPFDLLLDLLHVAHGHPAVAWRRDARGRAERVELTRHEAAALAELIERRAPTEACDLACLRAARLHDPVQVVERARRKVDARVSRYRWRAFVTSGGSGPERAFHFAPPAGFRYACLLPPRL